MTSMFILLPSNASRNVVVNTCGSAANDTMLAVLTAKKDATREFDRM